MTYLEQLLDGAKVEWRPLGEVAELKRGVRVVRRQLEKEGQYPVYQNCLTPLGYFDKANCKAETAFVIMGGSAGKVGFSNVDFWAADDCLYFITPEHLLSRYLYYFLCKKETYLDSQVRRAAVPRLARSVLANLLIPLPPLAVQERIVEILDKFTALIEALETELELRTRQYEYYRNRLLRFGKEVEWKPLGEVCVHIFSGHNREREPNGAYPVYGSTGIIARTNQKEYNTTQILVARVGVNAGYVHIATGEYAVSDNTLIVQHKEILLLRFLYYFLTKLNLNKLAYGGAQPLISASLLKKQLIPLPPLAVQEQIVAILDKFHTLVHSISEGLPAEIALRRRQYEYYRNLLLRFPFP
ncbi:MAG: restriction endonuclease subunit S [Bacteroides sp.]